MKVLVLGIDGMVGHKIAQSLTNNFEVFGSSRKKIKIQEIGLNKALILNHDFLKDDYNSLFNKIKPDYIINCIGLTTRRGASENIFNTEFLNTKLPYYINKWTTENNKKLIHFSTDCVFSGNKGNYLDNDTPDAIDLYGKSKGLGEINSDKNLTIRCSMIGREIFNHTELFEWLYSNKNGSIQGYYNVIYSGVTTNWMGNVLNKILMNGDELSGICNVASIPISKYDLLFKLSEAFKLNIYIKPNYDINSNKVLISKKFIEITGINPPNWEDLIIEFKKNTDLYSSIYKN